jgi:outer membrane biosynthesis protein TonB
MRFGGVLSIAFHVGLVAAGMIVGPALVSEPEEMLILPVELLEVSDSTNVAPVTEDAKEAEEPAEKESISETVTPAEAEPEAEEEILPSEAPAAKKEEPKKAETKKEEAKRKDSSLQSSLKDILAGVDLKEPKQQRSSADDRARNINDVADAGPRRGVGDKTRMTMTVADAIKSQLISKKCWTNHADMADARRLRAVIAVRFGRDGHFALEPKLIEPTREPNNDPPLQVYIQRARNALSKCNQMGFQIPEEYFSFNPPETIELVFLPGK